MQTPRCPVLEEEVPLISHVPRAPGQINPMRMKTSMCLSLNLLTTRESKRAHVLGMDMVFPTPLLVTM